MAANNSPADKIGPKAKKLARKDELMNVVRLEIATAVARTSCPPVMRDKDAPPPVSDMAPFPNGEAAWVPNVWRKNDDPDKPFCLVNPESPRVAFFRAIHLFQNRIADAGNDLITEMWLERKKPVPAKDASSSLTSFFTYPIPVGCLT